MRKEIEKFCEEIKEDYILFLYNKGDILNYPYCCKLSADIITSYLNLVLGTHFKYMYTTHIKFYNHAWTHYKSDKEDFIIDFTEIQFTNDFYRVNTRQEMNLDVLKNFIKTQKVVLDTKKSYFYDIYDLMKPKEQKCHGIINNFHGELNKNDFMAYLELVYDQVFENTVY